MIDADSSHPSRFRAMRVSALAGIVAAGALLAGCQRDEVAHFRVAKEATAPAAPAAGPMGGGMGGPMGGGMGGGMAGGEVAPPPAPAGGGLAWTLPAGWTDAKGGGGMRYATIKAAGGKVEATVVVLGGSAGGELANVNRWRNQISLPPLEEGDLAKHRKTVKTKAGSLAVYDFVSEEKKSRVVAGLTEHEGSTWFVKLSGDVDAVGAARPAFMNLLESLRFDAANP